MKKIALLALTAATSAVLFAPSAKADAGPSTTATSTISVTIPPTITFTVNDVAFGTLTDSTSNANGQSIAATLNTNYSAVALQVKAGAAGSRVRGGATTGTLLAGDIEVNNGSFQALTTTDAAFGTLSNFSPNVNKNYSFPVRVRHIDNYEQGAYNNTVVITATGS